MVITEHPLYINRLAGVYLDMYSKRGYISAKRWFDQFLTEPLRAKVGPRIRVLCSERGLTTDE